MAVPSSVHRLLRVASEKVASRVEFRSQVFGNEWDQFVEEWAPVIHSFVEEALGPYGTEPLPTILPLAEGLHAAQATASFDLLSGQISLCTSTEGKPGMILEKLTHEMVHGSLSEFPQGDCFYDEGVIDYTTWVLAHAPIWNEHRAAMIAAAEFNIAMRRERAFKDLSDYDRKRWAGGFYASEVHGPLIVARLRSRKQEGALMW